MDKFTFVLTDGEKIYSSEEMTIEQVKRLNDAVEKRHLINRNYIRWELKGDNDG